MDKKLHSLCLEIRKCEFTTAKKLANKENFNFDTFYKILESCSGICKDKKFHSKIKYNEFCDFLQFCYESSKNNLKDISLAKYVHSLYFILKCFIENVSCFFFNSINVYTLSENEFALNCKIFN